MLKIQCPKCKKSFFWTDEMPVRDKCPNPDCEWFYDVRGELRSNIEKRENNGKSEKQPLKLCPFCQNEIRSMFSVCSQCGRVVLGNKSFRKGYFFVAVCLFLVFLSFMIKYG